MYMKNAAYEVSKVFEGVERFENRIVAFVDVMGIRSRMKNAETPQELEMFSKLMHMYNNQPFAEDKIETIMFSDCMYLVAEPQYIKELICLLSNFAYNLLVNRTTEITLKEEGGFESNNLWDCFKLRGGITYGKILVLDEQAKKKKISFNSNIVLGPSVIAAYELESKQAVYPRIIVDEAFLSLLDMNQLSYEECYLVEDKNDKLYYLDFWKYMFKGKCGPVDFLIGCIKYVRKELDEAVKEENEKLVKQLKWFIEYLEDKVRCSMQ